MLAPSADLLPTPGGVGKGAQLTSWKRLLVTVTQDLMVMTESGWQVPRISSPSEAMHSSSSRWHCRDCSSSWEGTMWHLRVPHPNAHPRAVGNSQLGHGVE